MNRIMDVATISEVDVVETLKKFVFTNYSADIANDTAYEFASELTGISVDELLEHVEGY